MKRKAKRGLDLVLEPLRVEASLWRRLRFEQEQRCRAQLFQRYRPLARGVASRQFRLRQRNGTELGDLEQFAYEGLLHAIDRFDPLHGTPFAGYARRRIIGSIADGAARMNEIDAQHTARARRERERARMLAPEPGTAADPLRALSELAAGLALGLMLEGTSLIESESGADHRPNAYESLAWRELQALLVREVGRLPEREALILREHYEHGVSFTHIAQLLGISKGRVSQLHASALAKLRARVGHG